MLIITPPSSPPEKSLAFSSSSEDEDLCYFPFYQLPYQLPCSQHSPAEASDQLCNRQMRQISPGPRPSSPIPPSNGLEAALLIALNKAKEEAEDYGEGLVNQSQELAAHQAFVESDLNSTDNNDDEFETQPNNLFSFLSLKYTASKASSSGHANAWIDSCSLENAKMKLISILKGEAVIPK